MTAGPTPVPPRVSQAMAEPVLYHRAPAFVELYERVLRAPAGASSGPQNDVLAFAASGSGAMESAVANLVAPGRRRCSPAPPASSASAGSSSARPTAPTSSATSRAGARGSTRPRSTACSARTPTSRSSSPRCPRPRPASSTTSRRSPRSRREHDAILVVDAVSGLGAAELRQDEWGIDVVVAGSQKALMCPPGLAFASVSQRALDSAAAAPGRPLLLRLGRDRQGQRKDPPNSPFTPAVTLFVGLDVALDMIEEEGLENVSRATTCSPAPPAPASPALGLELFGDPDERSTVVTAVELPEDDRRRQGARSSCAKLGITANGGQDQLKGQDPAHRPLRLLRRLRHPHLAVRARDGARRARPRGRARRRRRRRPARLRRGRRPGRGTDRVTEPPAILVKEKIADSGVDLPARALRRRPRASTGADEELAERIGDYDGILIRSATKLTADLIERADKPEGDRPRRRRRGQRRRRRPRPSAASSSPTRRSPTSSPPPSTRRADARARPQHPAGARLAHRRQVGALEVRRRRGLREDARHPRLRPHRPARGRSARAASACTSSPTTRSWRPSATASSASRRPRPRTTSTRGPTSSRSTCPRRPRPRGWLDAEALRQDAGRRARHQLRPRRAGRRRGAQGRARLRQGRRRRARRVPAGADHRPPAVRRYANVVVTPHLGASTAEAQDRAGVQTAEQVVAALDRRRRLHRRQHPRDQRRGHGGARPVPAAVPSSSAASAMALAEGSLDRPRRGRVPRPHRRARHAPAHARGAQRRARRPHRGGGQPRQRARAGRGARDRGRPRPSEHERARLHRPRPRDRRSPAASACASSARRSGRATARTCSRPGASASTSSSTPHLALFRYSDVPGMVGRVGTRFGEHGDQHRLRRRRAASPTATAERRRRCAVMAVTTDAPVPPRGASSEIVASDGFVDGRTLSLQ